jgi:hypothetical protein
MRKKGKWRSGNVNSGRTKGRGRRVSWRILKTIYADAGCYRCCYY